MKNENEIISEALAIVQEESFEGLAEEVMKIGNNEKDKELKEKEIAERIGGFFSRGPLKKVKHTVQKRLNLIEEQLDFYRKNTVEEIAKQNHENLQSLKKDDSRFFQEENARLREAMQGFYKTVQKANELIDKVNNLKDELLDTIIGLRVSLADLSGPFKFLKSKKSTQLIFEQLEDLEAKIRSINSCSEVELEDLPDKYIEKVENTEN